MRKIKPEQVYVVVLTFFAVCAGARYASEYVYAALAEPTAAVETSYHGQ